MAVIRLTKEFSFEMAHALSGYDGVCREIHGHSYRLFVTVSGEPVRDTGDPKFGMVMDFGVLKKIVNDNVTGVYDHSLLIRRGADTEEVLEMLGRKFCRVMAVDYQPTCENLLIRFVDLIGKELPAGVKLFSLRLHETATSYAEWFAADNT